jgi:NADH-quinone oxidoreductase subunit J
MSLTNEIQYGLFILFSVISIASAIFIVRQKNVFYSSIALAFLGISVAVLIALINPSAYAFYSAFHFLLYVGSAVVFLSISLLVFKTLTVKEINVPWAGVTAVVTGAILFLILIVTFYNTPTVSTGLTFNLQSFANIFLEKYWFPALIIIIALLTTMIEALSLARGEKG